MNMRPHEFANPTRPRARRRGGSRSEALVGEPVDDRRALLEHVDVVAARHVHVRMAQLRRVCGRCAAGFGSEWPLRAESPCKRWEADGRIRTADPFIRSLRRMAGPCFKSGFVSTTARPTRVNSVELRAPPGMCSIGNRGRSAAVRGQGRPNPRTGSSAVVL
jgi:hypothetical protein